MIYYRLIQLGLEQKALDCARYVDPLSPKEDGHTEERGDKTQLGQLQD
jgi:hypothetical protein